MYRIKFSDKSKIDLAKLKKSEPKALKKAVSLLKELRQHPKTGTGKLEKLKGNRANQWSRRITEKHRLVY